MVPLPSNHKKRAAIRAAMMGRKNKKIKKNTETLLLFRPIVLPEPTTIKKHWEKMKIVYVPVPIIE